MKIHCLDNPNGIQKDVVIATVPWTDSAIPLMAPAVLKPIVEQQGFSCLAVDLNVEIYNATKDHPYKDKLLRFFFDEYMDADIEDWVSDCFESMADSILSWNPKIVGLSLFSYVCQASAKWLSYYIKKKSPHVQIVIGGAGCLKTFTGPSDYVSELLEQKIVDFHIRGDGEKTFAEFLKGNRNYPGINSENWQELTNSELLNLPIPDYNDYIFPYYEKQVLPLVGSRGCVRQCTFCDYIANWKNFNWRTAENIFEEMMLQNEKYGISYFKFQDSLTNGNLKEFNKLMAMIGDHNDRNPANKFKWSGYYIFRENTAASDRDWKIIAKSGAENLSVGIENLNEHIRYAIGKKFSNKAIDYHLEQAQKYQIQIYMLNIVGYITETQQDIDFAKQWLRDHVKYTDILYLQWGGTLGIFPNTYLDTHASELGIIKIDKHPQAWTSSTITSTPAIRAAWAQELNELSKKLGYRVFDNIDNHFILETLINDKFSKV